MTKQIKKEIEKSSRFREHWVLDKNFPEENIATLNERFEAAEKWEAKKREQGPPFNEQFCIDVYVIAVMMTKDNSFKGKFNPGELYDEMCEIMKELRKGKKDYSLYDEAKVLGMVMDKHRKAVTKK
jgi:hypothetical protein